VEEETASMLIFQTQIPTDYSRIKVKHVWREAVTNPLIYGTILDSELSVTLHPRTRNVHPAGKNIKVNFLIFEGQ
jgi:hypothetical protein